MRSKRLQNYNYKQITRNLGITFKRPNMLAAALTHSSSAQGKRLRSNEKLEFLGDAVLELVVRQHLYDKYPQKSEGGLSELKKAYTSEDALYRIGRRLSIGDYLIMDLGEALSGGRKRPSNISNGLEALIGAIYIDRGLSYVRRFIVRHIMTRRPSTPRDYKSLLNHWAMKNIKKVVYEVTKESGPPHARQFRVALMIDGKKSACGTGTTKKKAEQEAAKKYMQRRKKQKIDARY